MPKIQVRTENKRLGMRVSRVHVLGRQTPHFRPLGTPSSDPLSSRALIRAENLKNPYPINTLRMLVRKVSNE